MFNFDQQTFDDKVLVSPITYLLGYNFLEYKKPYTEYGALAWSSAPKTYLVKIDRNLKKSITTSMFKKKHDTFKSYYKYLNINFLEHQIKILQGKFMWKLINDEHQKLIKDKYSLKRGTAINNHTQRKLIVITQQSHHYPIKEQKYGIMKFDKY